MATASLAGTPAAGTGGTYDFSIAAANGVLPNASESFMFTVNQAPAITIALRLSPELGDARIHANLGAPGCGIGRAGE